MPSFGPPISTVWSSCLFKCANLMAGQKISETFCPLTSSCMQPQQERLMTLRTEERHTRSDSGALTDFELVERVRGGELALYELIMRRYNQRLFRIAPGILQ